MTPTDLITPRQLEGVSRALCARRSVDSCAAICMSHLSGNREPGACPEAVRVFGEDVRAVVQALPLDWLSLIEKAQAYAEAAAQFEASGSTIEQFDPMYDAELALLAFARSTKEPTDAAE